MEFYFKIQLNATEKKMASYMTLLNFRYINLCVKAEAASLIPVNVNIFGEDKDIEEVAEVAIQDDYHLAVFPKNDEYIRYITQGVINVHPEFKLSMKTMKAGAEERQYLEYEMPEVDKNRYDALTEGVNSLHDECKLRLDEIHAENVASVSDLFKGNPDDLDAVKKELDRVHDDYVEKTKGVRDKKLEEIEEGYQRYLEAHPEEIGAGIRNEEHGEGYNVTQGMRMFDSE